MDNLIDFSFQLQSQLFLRIFSLIKINISRSLGPLQLLRIWHDNSGRDMMASWFLNYVLVRDVQTGEKFHFVVNKWLAVERDDGEVRVYI